MNAIFALAYFFGVPRLSLNVRLDGIDESGCLQQVFFGAAQLGSLGPVFSCVSAPLHRGQGCRASSGVVGLAVSHVSLHVSRDHPR